MILTQKLKLILQMLKPTQNKTVADITNPALKEHTLQGGVPLIRLVIMILMIIYSELLCLPPNCTCVIHQGYYL